MVQTWDLRESSDDDPRSQRDRKIMVRMKDDKHFRMSRLKIQVISSIFQQVRKFDNREKNTLCGSCKMKTDIYCEKPVYKHRKVEGL